MVGVRHLAGDGLLPRLAEIPHGLAAGFSGGLAQATTQFRAAVQAAWCQARLPLGKKEYGLSSLHGRWMLVH